MNKILLTMASAAVLMVGVSSAAMAGNNDFTIGNVDGNRNLAIGGNANNSTFVGGDYNSNTVNGGVTVQGGTGGSAFAIGKGGDGGDARQGQQQGIFGSGNSTIGDVGNNNGNLTDVGNASQSQIGINDQGQNQSTDNANNSSQSVYIEGDEASDIPVSSAYAAPLTSADDTCMGSTSAGVQAMGFGISIGSTWRDEDCVRRKDSRMFYNMKMTDVAVARMCQKADNRAAIEAAGSVCPGTEASATPVAAAATELTTVSSSTDWNYLDNDRGHGDN